LHPVDTENITGSFWNTLCILVPIAVLLYLCYFLMAIDCIFIFQ